ncbi:hypothetical protein GXY_08969 [Novacetimonas hansenii ATCC 23769]|nr:hypothetical protein GXY_08969 [Novacetimonas hansenii ATCC 23769]GBQ61628.1 hypothetical protein AA0243_2711 [Novacetimonas hansenii NRIC 0243]
MEHHCLLTDGQQAFGLRGNGSAGTGMGMDHELYVRARLVNGAVNIAASEIHPQMVIAVFALPLFINLDQVGGRDLMKQQVITVDE